MTEPRDLGSLIDAVKHANGWSDEDIVRRARAAGHTLSKQTVSRTRTEPVLLISAKLMHALAAGMGVALVDVVRAALVSAGLPDAIGESISAEWAIRHDPDVPAQLRRVLLTLLADAKLAEAEDHVQAQRERRSEFALAAHEDPGDGESRRTQAKRRRPRQEGTKDP
jgi:hypothetical protein